MEVSIPPKPAFSVATLHSLAKPTEEATNSRVRLLMNLVPPNVIAQQTAAAPRDVMSRGTRVAAAVCCSALFGGRYDSPLREVGYDQTYHSPDELRAGTFEESAHDSLDICRTIHSREHRPELLRRYSQPVHIGRRTSGS